MSKRDLPDDLFDKVLDALDEPPEQSATGGLRDIPGLLERGYYDKAIDIMIKIIEDPDPYTLNDKIAVTDIAKQVAHQDPNILRRILPYFYVIYNKTEAYLTRASPDPVLIMNVANVLTLCKQELYEEISNLKQKIIDVANQISNEYKTNNIPLGDLAPRVGLSLVVVLLLVDEMLLNKEINGHYDSVGDILSLESDVFTCYNCGAQISKDDEKCANCGMEFPKCVICRLLIRTSPVKCPKCGNAAHREHMLEWLKMSYDKKKGKGMCPICQNYLSPEDLV
ncbi:MAG: hypothetical protein ACTSRG_04265 [Candidatus Helarchaeota archaeon]